MNLRNLEIFIAVAEEGSMSAVARQYYLSQSTVSDAIKNLEDTFHVHLFDRQGNRLHITAEGQEFLQHARTVVACYDDLKQAMRRLHEPQKFHIGITTSIGPAILPYLVRGMHEHFPSLDMYSSANAPGLIYDQLLDKALEAAIVEGEVKDDKLIAEPVLEDHLVIAMNSNHPLAHRTSISPQDLVDWNFVMGASQSPDRVIFEKAMAAARLPVKIRVDAVCLDCRMAMIRTNQFLTVESETLIHDYLKSGEFYAYYDPGKTLNLNVNIVYTPEQADNEYVRYLRQLLKRYAYPAWDFPGSIGTISFSA